MFYQSDGSEPELKRIEMLIGGVYRERFMGVNTDSQAIKLFMEFKSQVESAGLYAEKN